jgi:hypothetical protein
LDTVEAYSTTATPAETFVKASAAALRPVERSTWVQEGQASEAARDAHLEKAEVNAAATATATVAVAADESAPGPRPVKRAKAAAAKGDLALEVVNSERAHPTDNYGEADEHEDGKHSTVSDSKGSALAGSKIRQADDAQTKTSSREPSSPPAQTAEAAKVATGLPTVDPSTAHAVESSERSGAGGVGQMETDEEK